jgi:hypothetical protein
LTFHHQVGCTHNTPKWMLLHRQVLLSNRDIESIVWWLASSLSSLLLIFPGGPSLFCLFDLLSISNIAFLNLYPIVNFFFVFVFCFYRPIKSLLYGF